MGLRSLKTALSFVAFLGESSGRVVGEGALSDVTKAVLVPRGSWLWPGSRMPSEWKRQAGHALKRAVHNKGLQLLVKDRVLVA